MAVAKLPGKGDRGWEKSVFASFFGRSEDREFVGEKKVFGASCSTSNTEVIACCQTYFDYGASKVVFKVQVAV